MPRHRDVLNDDDLVIEVDGVDVHLDSVDANAMLRLTVDYLDLLMRIASENGEEISFKGLKAIEKCAAVAVRPNDVELARAGTVSASHYLARRERPPRGLIGAIDAVRNSRRALPVGYEAKVRIRGFEGVIFAEPNDDYAPSPYSTLSVRAEVVRVGGSRPRAQFKSKSESRPFILDIPQGEAPRLGQYLYETVDIVAKVARDRDRHIESGELKEFFPVSKRDPQAWRDWFRESGVESLAKLRDRQSDDDKQGGGHDDGPS